YEGVEVADFGLEPVERIAHRRAHVDRDQRPDRAGLGGGLVGRLVGVYAEIIGLAVPRRSISVISCASCSGRPGCRSCLSASSAARLLLSIRYGPGITPIRASPCGRLGLL